MYPWQLKEEISEMPASDSLGLCGCEIKLAGEDTASCSDWLVETTWANMANKMWIVYIQRSTAFQESGLGHNGSLTMPNCRWGYFE